MNAISSRRGFIILFCINYFFLSCSEESPIRQRAKKIFNYKEVLGLVKETKASTLISDSTNLLDEYEFDPFKDSIHLLLADVEEQLKRDSMALAEVNIANSRLYETDSIGSITILSEPSKDTFTQEVKQTQTQEVIALKYNLDQLRRIDTSRGSTTKGNCRQKSCKLWADISKRKQMMYLYLDGVLADSFKVSTGDTKHETPTFDTRPSGPMFKKYTSRKFPGGNYQGLGNMPYVVFIKGGFAIHGTTTGNIARLGKKASHGCIRLHPDNGKLFFELVNIVGLSETWITVSEN